MTLPDSMLLFPHPQLLNTKISIILNLMFIIFSHSLYDFFYTINSPFLLTKQHNLKGEKETYTYKGNYLSDTIPSHILFSFTW